MGLSVSKAAWADETLVHLVGTVGVVLVLQASHGHNPGVDCQD